MATTTKRERTSARPASGTRSPGTVEQARADIQKVFGIEMKYSAELDEHRRASATLRTQSGAKIVDAALAGDGEVASRSLIGRISDAADAIELCRATIKEARQRRELAITRLRAAEAAAKRAEAQPLIDEAEGIEKRDQELRADFRALQGVEVWTQLEYINKWGSPLHDPGSRLRLELAQSVVLRNRVQTLLQAANAIEATVVVKHGSLVADSVDEVLAQIRSDPMRIAPTIDSVQTWATPQLAQVAERAGRNTSPDLMALKLRCELTWRDGEIVTAASRIEGTRASRRDAAERLAQLESRIAEIEREEDPKKRDGLGLEKFRTEYELLRAELETTDA